MKIPFITSYRIAALQNTPARSSPSPQNLLFDEDFRSSSQRSQVWNGITDLDKNFAIIQHLVETNLDYSSEFLIDFDLPDSPVLKKSVISYLKRCFRKNGCDFYGRLSFAEMYRLHMRQKLIIGDSLIVKTQGGKLQLINPVRIRKGSGAPECVNKDGLVLDDYDRITGFAVSKMNYGQGTHLTVVPAENCIFDATRKEAQQLRGVSLMLPAFNVCRDHQDLLSNTLITARVQAAFGVVFYRDYQSWGALGGANVQVPNIGNPIDFTMRPGSKVEVGKDERVEMLESKVPHQSYFAFVKTLTQMAYSCLQTPYFFYDPESIGYTAAKGAVSVFKSSLIKRKREALETLSEMVSHILTWGVVSGELNLDGKRVWEVVERIRLTNLATLILDPQKETASIIAQISAGLNTLSDGIAELSGQSFEEVIERRAYEQQLCKALGVTVQTAQPGAPTTNDSKPEEEK